MQCFWSGDGIIFCNYIYNYINKQHFNIRKSNSQQFQHLEVTITTLIAGHEKLELIELTTTEDFIIELVLILHYNVNSISNECVHFSICGSTSQEAFVSVNYTSWLVY